MNRPPEFPVFGGRIGPAAGDRPVAGWRGAAHAAQPRRTGATGTRHCGLQDVKFSPVPHHGWSRPARVYRWLRGNWAGVSHPGQGNRKNGEMQNRKESAIPTAPQSMPGRGTGSLGQGELRYARNGRRRTRRPLGAGVRSSASNEPHRADATDQSVVFAPAVPVPRRIRSTRRRRWDRWASDGHRIGAEKGVAQLPGAHPRGARGGHLTGSGRRRRPFARQPLVVARRGRFRIDPNERIGLPASWCVPDQRSRAGAIPTGSLHRRLHRPRRQEAARSKTLQTAKGNRR